MIHGKIYRNKKSITTIKKNYCPDCGIVLSNTKITKVLNALSDENDIVPIVGSVPDKKVLLGNIEYTENGFKCPKCKKCFTVEEVRLANDIQKGKEIEEAVSDRKATRKWQMQSGFIFLILVSIVYGIFHLIKFFL